MSGEAVPAGVVEIAQGLWRWTSPHPDWRPGGAADGPDDWGREVGSVVYLAGGTCVFIDPLLAEPAASFWQWADGIVSGRRVVVRTTIQWHRRSCEAFIERYDAGPSVEATRLPSGVEPFVVREADETMFWLPEPRTLVPGDRILGRADGGLRLCPDSWMRYLPGQIGQAELAERLRPLLDLSIERVLVSHGEPVLSNGRSALANALAKIAPMTAPS